jgi:hypothetical protein
MQIRKQIAHETGSTRICIFEVKTSLGRPAILFLESEFSFTVTPSRHTLRGERLIPESSGEPSLAERARNS